MRIALLTVFVLLLGACDTTRNTPDPELNHYLRLYGSDGSQEAIDMVVNDDGTVILLGNSVENNFTPSQVYLVKVNVHGFVIWEKFFGDTDDWVAKDIEVTSIQSEYVIAAERVRSDQDSDFIIFTVSDSGSEAQIVNTGAFTFPGQSKEIPVSVTQVIDNGIGSGFIVTGSTNYDNGTDPGFEGMTAVFARFQQDCNPYLGAWVNNTGKEGDDFGVKVVQRDELTDSNGDATPEPFVFFGFKNSPPQDDVNNSSFNFWFSRLSDSGGDGVLSDVLKDSPIVEDEKLSSVTAINYGNLADYILAGIISTSTAGQERIFVSVVKDAALVESQTLAPHTLPYELGDLTQLGDKYRSVSTDNLHAGGYLIAANSTVGGNSEIFLTKLNVDGSVKWASPVLLGGQGDDRQAAVHELPDGKILLFGTMQVGDDRQPKMCLMKLNESGHLK